MHGARTLACARTGTARTRQPRLVHARTSMHARAARHGIALHLAAPHHTVLHLTLPNATARHCEPAHGMAQHGTPHCAASHHTALCHAAPHIIHSSVCTAPYRITAQRGTGTARHGTARHGVVARHGTAEHVHMHTHICMTRTSEPLSEVQWECALGEWTACLCSVASWHDMR